VGESPPLLTSVDREVTRRFCFQAFSSWRGQRALFAIADRSDAAGSNPGEEQVIAHRLWPAGPKSEVVLVLPPLVAMPFHPRSCEAFPEPAAFSFSRPSVRHDDGRSYSKKTSFNGDAPAAQPLLPEEPHLEIFGGAGDGRLRSVAVGRTTGTSLQSWSLRVG